MAHGRDIAGKLLVDLQVRKSTADGVGARDFYTKLTTPLPGWENEIRNVVLKKKLVRGDLEIGWDKRCTHHFVASEVVAAAQYFRRGWTSRTERVSLDTRRRDRELY